jgi:hypothetical protein
VLKIDFEKASDTVEHSAILEIKRNLGFPKTRINWIAEILSTSTSSILLNGVPGRKFACRREVRQGDPLSPLLYVLVGDLVQCIINKAYKYVTLLPHFPEDAEVYYPIMQYADDTLLVLPADLDKMLTVKNLMDIYSSITGLHVKFINRQ